MTLEWRSSQKPVPYDEAISFMEKRVEVIAQDQASELVWFLEHPSLYTIGTSGHADDILLNPSRLPTYRTGRGGQVIYHGPGQRIGYVLLNLKKRGLSPRAFIHCLETWILSVLSMLDIPAFTDPKRIGVWVKGFPGKPFEERKIAAIGVRIRQGVSFHGFALNCAPDLNFFRQIIACGLGEFQATSLEELGCAETPASIDALFQELFPKVFLNALIPGSASGNRSD